MVTKGMALTRGVSLMMIMVFMVLKAAGYGGEMGQWLCAASYYWSHLFCSAFRPRRHFRYPVFLIACPLLVSPRAQGVTYGAQEKSPHRNCPFAAVLRSRSDGGSSCNASLESHGKSSSHTMSHTLGAS